MKRYLHLLFILFLSANASTAQQATTSNVTIYIFLLEDCIISQHYAPVLNELHQQYANDSTQFLGVFPNRFSQPESIAAFKETYKIKFDLKYDYYQTVAKQFSAIVTPEVIVYDERNQQVIYQGRIDNQFVRVGRRRQVKTKNELADVLHALENGIPVETASVPSVGCFIKYEKN
jgi:peroxiredoxin